METIVAALVGGLFVLLGNYAMAFYQRKTFEIQSKNEKEKSRIEWERQEVRRIEERSFQLKKEAYGSWIALMRKQGAQPVQGMEVIAVIAALELCGSDMVRKEASNFMAVLLRAAEKNLSITEQALYAYPASQKLSAAILDDFRSYTQTETKYSPSEG